MVYGGDQAGEDGGGGNSLPQVGCGGVSHFHNWKFIYQKKNVSRYFAFLFEKKLLHLNLTGNIFSNLHRNGAFLVNFEVQFEIINYCFVTEFWYMYVYSNPFRDVWHRTSFLCPLLKSWEGHMPPPLFSLLIHSQMSDTGRVTCAPPFSNYGRGTSPPPILAFNPFRDVWHRQSPPVPLLKSWEEHVSPS